MNLTASPEWKVYFDGNFWGHHGRGHAGKELRLDRQFDWAGRHWLLPAAYACGKGLVVDLCMQVDAQAIRGFMKKWNLTNDRPEDNSWERRMEMEWDNPLRLSFMPSLEVNGKELSVFRGCSVCFNPCLPEGGVNELEGKKAADHYGLADSSGWVIFRYAFPWKRRPQISSLTLTMKQQPEQLPGPRFTVHAPGDTFDFSHPVTGTEFTLTVGELERQTIPGFGSDRWIYPTNCTVMRYTLSPEPEEPIAILDCAESDRPLRVDSSRSAAACGVICGADGPTAIGFAAEGQAACSALHFEPVSDDILWRVVFHVTKFEEGTFSLLSQKGDSYGLEKA